MVLLAIGDAISYIPDEWENTDDPDLFRSVNGYELYSTDTGWEIADTDGAPVARATTHAMHPTTVYIGEWNVQTAEEWKCADLCFVHNSVDTSHDNPISLDKLGFDYFLRHKQTKPLWFIDPITGETVHSGSKRMRNVEAPGVRYCPLCRCCISSNNFVTQHMRVIHPEQPVPGELVSQFIHRVCL